MSVLAGPRSQPLLICHGLGTSAVVICSGFSALPLNKATQRCGFQPHLKVEISNWLNVSRIR